jgi:hypothetical protein
MKHEHTPELRERKHYDPAVITADAWVCAECEAFLGATDRPIIGRSENG